MASGRTCAGRPAADSAGPATAARPGRTAGTHAPHKGVPGKSASATRTFAGSPVSCCTAFQRRSVTRLRRQQARLNRKAGLPGMEAFRYKKNPRSGPESTGAESTRRLPTRDAGRRRDGMHKDPAKLAQEFTQPHFYTPPATKSWRAEVRLQGKLQANRGCVTLQRRGCRSNSGLEVLRRTRSFPERTSSAGSVAAILWQLGTFMYRESHGAHAAVHGAPGRGGAQRHRGARLHEKLMGAFVTFWDNAGSGAGRGPHRSGQAGSLLELQMQLGSLYPHNPMKGASEHFHFLSSLRGPTTTRCATSASIAWLRLCGWKLGDRRLDSSRARIIFAGECPWEFFFFLELRIPETDLPDPRVRKNHGPRRIFPRDGSSRPQPGDRLSLE